MNTEATVEQAQNQPVLAKIKAKLAQIKDSAKANVEYVIIGAGLVAIVVGTIVIGCLVHKDGVLTAHQNVTDSLLPDIDKTQDFQNFTGRKLLDNDNFLTKGYNSAKANIEHVRADFKDLRQAIRDNRFSCAKMHSDKWLFLKEIKADLDATYDFLTGTPPTFEYQKLCA
jgi:hypothetical protein